MAGGDDGGAQFKGLSKYFNSVTDYGRANVAKATYAAIGLTILYFTLKPKKKTSAAPLPTTTGSSSGGC